MSAAVALLWLLNISLDTLGQISFKLGAIAHNDATGLHFWLNTLKSHWIKIGIACYAAEFVVWLAFLSLVPLSEGVVLASLNIVTVMIAGRIFLEEPLTRLRLLGIALVASGVAIVGINS
jgi:drug/metabolite transporter (DMT)-like permease